MYFCPYCGNLLRGEKGGETEGFRCSTCSYNAALTGEDFLSLRLAVNTDTTKEKERWFRYRKKCARVLDTRWVEYGILFFIFLDMIFVAFELLLDSCVIERTAKAKKISSVFHTLSVCVLILFTIEIFATIFRCGIKEFFSRFWFVFDFIIVVTSLIFDILFASSTGSLLVILRLWRVVRVVHGIITSSREKLVNQLHHLKLSHKRHLIQEEKLYNVVQNAKLFMSRFDPIRTAHLRSQLQTELEHYEKMSVLHQKSIDYLRTEDSLAQIQKNPLKKKKSPEKISSPKQQVTLQDV